MEPSEIIVGSRVVGKSRVFLNKRGRVDRIAEVDNIKKYYITWDDGSQNLVKEKSIGLFISDSPIKSRKGSYLSDVDMETPKKLPSDINDSLFDIGTTEKSLTPVSPSPIRNEREYNPFSNLPGMSDTDSKESTEQSNNPFDVEDFLEKHRKPVGAGDSAGKRKDVESFCNCAQF